MAKRRATARTRKPARKTKRTANRKASRSARTSASRKKAAIKSAKGKASSRASKRAAPKKAGSKRMPRVASRPTPLALQRERRRLREDESVPGAPSTLGYAPKASGAESGQQMYHQRKREHTE